MLTILDLTKSPIRPMNMSTERKTNVISQFYTLLDQDFLPDYPDSDEESEKTQEVAKLEGQVLKANDYVKESKQIHENKHDCSSPLSVQLDADCRTVYVTNVSYSACPKELSKHFHGCGVMNRLKILLNKFTGRPKGCAYIEFANKDSAGLALMMNGTFFKGRQLKVSPKRANVPGLSFAGSHSSEERNPRFNRDFRQKANKPYYRTLYRWFGNDQEKSVKSTRNYYSRF